jgi:hypothetical protein
MEEGVSKMIMGFDVGCDESYGAMVVMRRRPDNSLEVVASGTFNPSKPRCAKCNKLVDNLIETQDQRTRETILIAICHGQRETVRLSDELLEHVSGEIKFTDAFKGK